VIAGGSGNGLARSIAEYSGEAADYLKNPVLSTTLAAARGKSIQVNLVCLTIYPLIIKVLELYMTSRIIQF